MPYSNNTNTLLLKHKYATLTNTYTLPLQTHIPHTYKHLHPTLTTPTPHTYKHLHPTHTNTYTTFINTQSLQTPNPNLTYT